MVKMRGIDFKGGFHDFTIKRGGLKVYPRLVAAEHHKDFRNEVVAERKRGTGRFTRWRARTGNQRASHRSGWRRKIVFGAHLRNRRCSRQERSAIFAFDEGRGTMSARAATLGLPLADCIANGLIDIQQIDPAEMAPGEFASAVRESVEAKGASVVIIDSLNGYLNAMPDERFLILQMHELLSYLSQRGVLTILVLAQHGLVGPMDTPLDISYLADSVIMLRYFEFEGSVRRALSVVKKRSGNHEHSIREFKLSNKGITVGPALKGFKGIFSGTPVYEGDKAPLMDREL